MESGEQETLRGILASVNEWLRFAEAKNGALMVLNSAAMMAALAAREEWLDPASRTPFIVLVIGNGLSLITSILAFFPILHSPKGKLWGKPCSKHGEEPNPLFYRDIAAMEPSSYVTLLSRYGPIGEVESSTGRQPLGLPYAQQIVANSRIAMWKLRWFRVGALSTLLAFVGVMILMLRSAFWCIP